MKNMKDGYYSTKGQWWSAKYNGHPITIMYLLSKKDDGTAEFFMVLDAIIKLGC